MESKERWKLRIKSLKRTEKSDTYGPIIHNEEVVRELAGRGVRILETEEEPVSDPGGNCPDPLSRCPP